MVTARLPSPVGSSMTDLQDTRPIFSTEILTIDLQILDNLLHTEDYWSVPSVNRYGTITASRKARIIPATTKLQPALNRIA